MGVMDFRIFAAVYLVFTLYNTIVGYREATAQRSHALMNPVLGTVLVLVGTPDYLFDRRKPRRAH
jgi:hypothetical protein